MRLEDNAGSPAKTFDVIKEVEPGPVETGGTSINAGAVVANSSPTGASDEPARRSTRSPPPTNTSSGTIQSVPDPSPLSPAQPPAPPIETRNQVPTSPEIERSTSSSMTRTLTPRLSRKSVSFVLPDENQPDQPSPSKKPRPKPRPTHKAALQERADREAAKAAAAVKPTVTVSAARASAPPDAIVNPASTAPPTPASVPGDTRTSPAPTDTISNPAAPQCIS